MRKLIRKHRMALVGLLITLTFVVIGVLAPLVAPYDPLETHLEEKLQSPSAQHLLGTDEVGRDIFSRLVYGTRISLAIAVSSAALGSVIGVLIGATAGYHGGKVDLLLMQVMDVMMTIPPLVLSIAIVSVLKAGVPSVIIAVATSSIPVYARLTRGVVLTLRGLDFVQAATALGGSDRRIIFRHVLPNCIAPITVQVSLGAGTAILTAAALSFVGLGIQPPAPEWGAMLSRGRTYINTAPHLILFPGLTIALMVVGFNLLGDGLRDALDPRLRRLAN